MNDVVEVRHLDGYRVYLRFADGSSGELDLGVVISSFTGVFAPLKDEAEFAKVRVEPDLGTIAWPTGADLCPDVLYSKLTGKPIPWATEEAGSPGGNA